MQGVFTTFKFKELYKYATVEHTLYFLSDTSFCCPHIAGEEMTESVMNVTGRGITIASHHGGTHTVIVIIAGEAAAVVTVEVVAEVGARIVSETVREKGRGTEIVTETGSEIAAGADQTAELDPGAEVEVCTLWIDPVY